MSNLKAGMYINSTDELNGSFFEHATIQIIKHNDQESLGFVTNKALGKSLNDLVEFNNSHPFPLMDGGPVDREHLFVLHKRPDLFEGGEQVYDDFYLGGNMEQVIAAINTKSITNDELQIYIGYCGWDEGELQAEIEEGNWTIIN
jgi:putative transcriptional regulator